MMRHYLALLCNETQKYQTSLTMEPFTTQHCPWDMESSDITHSVERFTTHYTSILWQSDPLTARFDLNSICNTTSCRFIQTLWVAIKLSGCDLRLLGKTLETCCSRINGFRMRFKLQKSLTDPGVIGMRGPLSPSLFIILQFSAKIIWTNRLPPALWLEPSPGNPGFASRSAQYKYVILRLLCF